MPEKVVKPVKGVLLLEDGIVLVDGHRADADGVVLVAGEPIPGAGAHRGFGDNHRVGALGVLRPVKGEVQADGVESYRNLVVGRPFVHGVHARGESDVAGLVVAGLQQRLGLDAHPAVQVKEHVVAGDGVAVVGFDGVLFDVKGPDQAVVADGPLFGDGGGEFAAALAADHSDLEHPLELEILALGEEGVVLAVAEVGNQDGNIAAGGRGHHRIGSLRHRGRCGGGRGRGSRSGGGGGRLRGGVARHGGNQPGGEAGGQQRPPVKKSLQSHREIRPPVGQTATRAALHWLNCAPHQLIIG